MTELDRASPPAPAPRRPKLISGLIVFWLLGAVFFPVVGFRAYQASGELPSGSVPATVISAVIAYGLWAGLPWTRIFLMVVLVPMMCLMPVGFAAFLLIAYLRRRETRSHFAPDQGGPTWQAAPNWSASEWPWVLAVLLALAVGVGLLVAMRPLARVW